MLRIACTLPEVCVCVWRGPGSFGSHHEIVRFVAIVDEILQFNVALGLQLVEELLAT